MTETMGTTDINEAGATVRFERTLAAPVGRVWGALTDESQLARWLASGTFEADAGGALAFDFGEGGTVTGEITTWEPPNRLGYSWQIPGEQASTVEWTLRADGAGTRLELVHSTLPEKMGLGYTAGWHAYLERLEAVARDEEGPDFDPRFEELLAVYAG